MQFIQRFERTSQSKTAKHEQIIKVISMYFAKEARMKN